MGDFVWDALTREKVLELLRRAETPDQPCSLSKGEGRLVYHGWVGAHEQR
jgi:hypothetical protein